MSEVSSKEKKLEYPGQGHPWADFLHHRARAIDWLYAGEGSGHCKGDDDTIAKNLSMSTTQVTLIRTRDRRLPRMSNQLPADQLIAKLREELEKRAFHNGDGEFRNIEYCDFCGYSKEWLAHHDHGDDCLLKRSAT